MKAIGKKSVEWDLNDWKWDGDLFTAAPLNPLPSDCRGRQLFPVRSEIPANIDASNSSSSCSDELNVGDDNGKRELEKRRRVIVVEDEELNDEAGSLSLKLGGQLYPITEGEMDAWVGKSGKKTKIAGPTLNRAVCQVEDCRADLSNAKDYHRRHKVCDMHSKATRALVGNVMQRFCQQCSRFHVLQEFDEGKRSCRRRLAGHNRRRRKTHPENVVNGTSLNDERGSSYLLLSLLRMLTNIHSNSSDQTKDQDLLSHLLKNLVNLSGTMNEKNLSGIQPGQDSQNAGTSIVTTGKDPLRTMEPCLAIPAPEMIQKRISADHAQNGGVQAPFVAESAVLYTSQNSISIKANVSEIPMGGMKLSNIDLNNAYDDSQDHMENLGTSDTPINVAKGPSGCPFWLNQDLQKSSPPQTSRNSGSTSSQSPSSSSGEAQSRTDRIVFKLFGKDPGDFPLVLRKQILDWLSNSPTDIESYIRPGCIILTVYLRMTISSWEQISSNLSYSLRRLLDASNDSFWTTGWVYARMQQRVAFLYNGQVVLDTSLALKSHKHCRISSIRPIAVSVSSRAQFLVKGFNLSRNNTRLLCALEGKYLVQGNCSDMVEGPDLVPERDEIQSLSFSCSIPDFSGRGFIEVEDYGLSSSFFPFIVAEKDVCSEIRTLENTIELTETADDMWGETDQMVARSLALDFVHEMGWLLHRSRLNIRLGGRDPNLSAFPFGQFKWLMEFSIDHDWCGVVKKLLDVLFSGTVDAGEHPSTEAALIEIGPLHRAVQRNCRPMVEVLLRYNPDKLLSKSASDHKQHLDGSRNLLRPDLIGPGGLTPLHIAASRQGSENVLDALTDDPGLVGIEAWKSARDIKGLTPNDYASLRGLYSYIHLVQKKLDKKSGNKHVVVDIPANFSDTNTRQKLADGHGSGKFGSFQMEKTARKPIYRCCKVCEQKLAYGSARTSLAIYKPAMLSMVAIAAVCVCVALLFKSSPEVLYVFQPFRWELLKYGSS